MHHSTLGFELQDATPGFIFEVGSLYDELQTVGDTRKARGKRWSTALVLLFALLAKLAGQDSARGIATWINLRIQTLNEVLQLPVYHNRKREVSGPHATTYARVLGRTLNHTDLDKLVHRYATCQRRVQQAKQVCLDGKTLRGTISAQQPLGVRVLEAYQPQTGVGLRQTEIGAQQAELSVAAPLLKGLNLQGKIVTADALFTQRALSTQIVAAGGDYVWKVKHNQSQLCADIALTFAQQTASPGSNVPPRDERVATTVDDGHGRIERRTLKVSSDLQGYVDWPQAAQVFAYAVRVFHPQSGKRSERLTYGLTSLSAAKANPQQLLQLVRAHWGIENGLHYRRDVTLHEDAGRWRLPHLGFVMALLNTLVLGLLGREQSTPAQRLACDANPFQALKLLLKAPG
jgi:predicted transposase YbfD/YdcC